MDAREEDNRIYQNERKELLAAELSNSESFDKAILSLSSAALGLSIGFLKEIVAGSVTVELWMLTASWWIFCLAIMLTVISFPVSQKAIRIQLDYAQKYYLQGKLEYGSMPNCANAATLWLNLISGAAFVLAVILTVLFVSLNVELGESSMAKKQLNEGALIAPFQPSANERRGQTLFPLQPSSQSSGTGNQSNTGAQTQTPSGSNDAGKPSKKKSL